MVKFSKLHFLIGIVASVLLVVQAVFGIMMYVNGGDTQQRMMGQPTNTNTTDSTTEDSTDSDTAATDDSTTATTPNRGQGNMGTPPQGWPNGSGIPGETPSGGGFQGGDSLGKVINFYQGVGGLATSIIVLVIGGAGLVTSVMSRKSAA
ncbi:hypothetical protein NGI46_01215 [Peribacillus butanolivorans]|uniref:hypothetical protein n=1 Tax=Peribacillus butanolivorans TaxID=421767 RepID=UPI00207CA1D0|nr:hypothetical protein [Peribacillus butanolivorans]MCO0596081.1 hypothetical protein [Peribacillus butanolivorans]